MDSAYIYLWEGKFIYIGKSISTYTHANHAVEISISLGKPMKINRGHDLWQESQGIIIGADENHECMIPLGNGVIHIGLDPESLFARKLTDKFLQGDAISFLAEDKVSNFVNKIKQVLNENKDSSRILDILNEFFSQLLGVPCLTIEAEAMDSRIRKIIFLLKESHEDKFSLKQLANVVGLSPGRLVHLFKEQVGIPIRRYALWIKLNRAVLAIVQEKNLTEAAHNAGFADSAHFSRTFLRMFGVPPSEILKNSQIVLGGKDAHKLLESTRQTI